MTTECDSWFLVADADKAGDRHRIGCELTLGHAGRHRYEGTSSMEIDGEIFPVDYEISWEERAK